MDALKSLCVLLILFQLTESTKVEEVTVSEAGREFLVFSMKNKGDVAHINKVPHDIEELKLFCYDGIEPNVFKFWSSAAFKLELDSQEYKVYLGPNVTTVTQLHEMSESYWWYRQLPWKTKEFRMDPFQDACIGVKTSKEYTMGLQIKNINYMMFFLTLIAVITFMWAPKLCRNQFFHYTTGISAGILLSVLILTFLVQRKLKVQLLSWISIAYSLAVYLLTNTWYNFKEYLTEQYIHWFVGYVLCVGLFSFGLIYRMGAPSNPKTLNLIQWTMQGVSLVCVVLSSYYQPASVGLALLMILWSLIPATVKSRVRTYARKTLFRPKVKLLSEEEYQAQRNKETRKALEELRNYCQSPESKPWLTVTKLNSPSRFAEFVEGSPHITEKEIMDYSHWDNLDTDDDDNERYSRSDITDDEDFANRSLDSQGDATL